MLDEPSKGSISTMYRCSGEPPKMTGSSSSSQPTMATRPEALSASTKVSELALSRRCTTSPWTLVSSVAPRTPARPAARICDSRSRAPSAMVGSVTTVRKECQGGCKGAPSAAKDAGELACENRQTLGSCNPVFSPTLYQLTEGRPLSVPGAYARCRRSSASRQASALDGDPIPALAGTR